MGVQLTDRQKEIYDFIAHNVEEKGYSPSIWEIAERFGIRSPRGVADHLKALQKKGYIRRVHNRPRGIELTHGSQRVSPDETIEIPILGRIAAGLPIQAIDNLEGTLSIPRNFLKGERLFALKVRGNSMVEAGILDGDLVIARPQKTAENGDIVVALIGDEATVKSYYQEGNLIILKPANNQMDPIVIQEGDFLIQGKIVGLYRRYEK